MFKKISFVLALLGLSSLANATAIPNADGQLQQIPVSSMSDVVGHGKAEISLRPLGKKITEPAIGAPCLDIKTVVISGALHLSGSTYWL